MPFSSVASNAATSPNSATSPSAAVSPSPATSLSALAEFDFPTALVVSQDGQVLAQGGQVESDLLSPQLLNRWWPGQLRWPMNGPCLI